MSEHICRHVIYIRFIESHKWHTKYVGTDMRITSDVFELTQGIDKTFWYRNKVYSKYVVTDIRYTLDVLAKVHTKCVGTQTCYYSIVGTSRCYIPMYGTDTRYTPDVLFQTHDTQYKCCSRHEVQTRGTHRKCVIWGRVTFLCPDLGRFGIHNVFTLNLDPR